MIAGIYLAAGNSTRMGQQKQRLRLGECPLGSWGLQALLDSFLDVVIVVVRPLDTLQWIIPALKTAHKLRIITCVDASKGQSASIKCGTEVAAMLGAKASIITLADMPFVSKKHIHSLIEVYQRQEGDYVATHSGESMMPPILFHQKMFQELLALKGDAGAKKVLERKKWKGTYLYSPPYQLMDIDTEADYEKAKNILNWFT